MDKIVYMVAGLAVAIVLVLILGSSGPSGTTSEPYGKFNSVAGLHTTITVYKDPGHNHHSLMYTTGIHDGILYLLSDKRFDVNQPTMDMMKDISRIMKGYKLDALSIQFTNHKIEWNTENANMVLSGKRTYQYLFNVINNQ
jgi:hypothetical protein